MVRVGIVGLGFMGMIHYLGYQKVRGAKVQAMCEKDPVRLSGDWRSIKGNFGPQGTQMDLSGIRRYSEIEEMMADPDVDMVDICLPPSMHVDATLAALKAGKHVLCEKPIALKLADADRMVKAARDAGKLLMIAHVLPFVPEYNFAYKTITSGKYGRVIGGHFKRVISDPKWLRDFYSPDVCGGPMLDLHIHDAHFIRLIFGMPQSVQSAGRMRGEVAEYFTSQFLYEDPSLVVTATSGAINQQGRPFTHGYEIHLEKATMYFECGVPLTVLTNEGKKQDKAFQPNLGTFDMPDAFPGELSEAVRAVKTGEPSPLLNGQLARDAVLLCQRQTQSIVKRKPIKV